MLITDHGQIIRSPMESMATYSRAATGTILMRPAEGEKVIAVQSIPGDVVENSRRTSEARSLERKALREQEEAAKANAAPEAQQEEPSNDAAAEGESSDGNEDNGEI